MEEMILDLILHIADIKEDLNIEDREKHERAAWYLNAALQELKDCNKKFANTCK